MSDATAGSAADGDGDYTIRPFDPDEVDAFLDLYHDVFDGRRDRAWFDWKYEDNPYTDRPPIVVAERDGELVGARPFFALPLQVAGEERLALQPADTMVHPDHRRRGLFTRMTERAIDRYRDRAALFFNFPNENSRPGYLKLGWEVVQDVPTYYRVEDPGALAGDGPAGALAPALSAGARAYLRAREALAADPDGFTVSRHETVPADRLAALYRERVPEEMHLTRDARFFEWRFGAAPADYTTYLAERDGDPRAAVLTTGGTHGDAPIVQLVEALPMGADDRTDAMVALVRAVLDDGEDRAAVVAPAGPFPDAALAALGFHRRDGLLARFTAPTVHVARTLEADEPSQTVAGRDVRDPDNWLLSFAAFDTR